MARFRSNEARKKERKEKTADGVDDDIDWSQAVGITPPPGTVPEGTDAESDESDEDADFADEDESTG